MILALPRMYRANTTSFLLGRAWGTVFFSFSLVPNVFSSGFNSVLITFSICSLCSCYVPNTIPITPFIFIPYALAPIPQHPTTEA